MTVAPAPLRVAPGPRGKFLVGNLFDARDSGLLAYHVQAWKDYGDVVKFQMGPLTMLQIVRPEHVQQVMVSNAKNYIKGLSHENLRKIIGDGILTAEGDAWQRQRRLMQPTYTPKAVTDFAQIMGDATRGMLKRWDERKSDGPVMINQEMMRVTMSVISLSMFGLDVGEDFKETGDGLRYLLQYVSERGLSSIDLPMWVPTDSHRKLQAATRQVDDFLYGVIRERRRNGLGQDLLSLLMTAKDADTGAEMSEKQLRDEVLITFFAGHETTAQTLTWTLAMLAQHPEIERRLWEELDRVLGGRSPTIDDIASLTYTRQVIDETLRLYSPVAVMARDTVAADALGEYAVGPSNLILVLPFMTHRHPEFWEQPDAFDPEHFTPERVKARPRYAYLPFGAGPRTCLGMHFALLEAVLILADVAQRYRIGLANPKQELEYDWAGTLRPKGDLPMTLSKR